MLLNILDYLRDITASLAASFIFSMIKNISKIRLKPLFNILLRINILKRF